MTIGLTGASGFIGAQIISAAKMRGYEVIGFSRRPQQIPGCSETRVFGARQPVDLSGCGAVVHLAGEPVFGLWTKKKRRKILASRKLGTRHLVDAILAAPNPPRVLIAASAVGFYGDTGEQAVDETASAGSGFLAEVTQNWEAEAKRAEQIGVRVVMLRFGIVLGRDGGALELMLPIFRLGAGAVLGTGRQWMSWIHVEDAANLALLAIENEQANGPLNATAPAPRRNSEFTRVLASTLHRPALFRVPAVLLQLTLGDFAHELLDNKRVLPGTATGLGYSYRFPRLSEALLEASARALPRQF
jgi:uncharacterized protein (TIGR01777 family)